MVKSISEIDLNPNVILGRTIFLKNRMLQVFFFKPSWPSFNFYLDYIKLIITKKKKSVISWGYKINTT